MESNNRTAYETRGMKIASIIIFLLNEIIATSPNDLLCTKKSKTKHTQCIVTNWFAFLAFVTSGSLFEKKVSFRNSLIAVVILKGEPQILLAIKFTLNCFQEQVLTIMLRH